MENNLKIKNTTLTLAVTTIVLTILLVAQKADSQTDQKWDHFEAPYERILKTKSSIINKVPMERDTKEKPINYRLPKTMIPSSYKLYLHPHLQSGNFSGQVAINIDVQSKTKQIILHSKNLIINAVSVQGQRGENLKIANYSLDTVRQFLVINMVKELTPNSNIKLGITFQGSMLNKLVGLYRSTYSTPSKDIRSLAVSQLEATFAREAFPCFDEPQLKANFDITLVHPSGDNYHALSNMNEISSKVLGEYTETRFNNSVKMSTYIVCFLVSDYAYKTATVNARGIGKNFDLRVFAAEHKIDSVDFALEAAVAIMEQFIQYFEIEYPLPKLDMAAIPDFKGAMENWGLITYQEYSMLYDKKNGLTLHKQGIARLIAHELAHMWFGNLVTMKWWNDLWLNEGFASFFEIKGVHAAYPKWGMLDQFLIDTVHKVMEMDASIFSSSIIQVVESPDEIRDHFGDICYKKGGAVLRMLENVVGSTKFEHGVRNYLNKFKYRNTETNDLLNELALMNLDFDVKLMVRTWTEQMGYPVVEVKRTGDGKFNVTQKRFLSNIADYNFVFDDSPFDYKWIIPLTYTTNQQGPSDRVWFELDKASVEIAVPATTKWIKLNNDQMGYYIVNYEEDNWLNIIEDLKKRPLTAFSISDRAHLLHDAFTLADAGQLDSSIPMAMTKYLENEVDYVPWAVAARKLKKLRNKMRGSESLPKYLQNLISKIYTEVGWTADEDNHLRNLLRVTVLDAACDLGHPDCLNEAAFRLNAWLSDPSAKPSPDLRGIVCKFGSRRMNSEEAWYQMLNSTINNEKSTERYNPIDCYQSSVRSPKFLQRFDGLSGNEEKVKVQRQNYFNILENIMADSPEGETVVWDFVRKQWPAMVERFGSHDVSMHEMLLKISENFDSPSKLEELQNFFDKYPEAGLGTSTRQKAVEKVKNNIQWQEQNKAVVVNWLQKHFENSDKVLGNEI